MLGLSASELKTFIDFLYKIACSQNSKSIISSNHFFVNAFSWATYNPFYAALNCRDYIKINLYDTSKDRIEGLVYS